jgi:hypothetical protein
MAPSFVILGLVPRTQHPENSDAFGWMDGRDEPDHDNDPKVHRYSPRAPSC